jgi:hypothetical protein
VRSTCDRAPSRSGSEPLGLEPELLDAGLGQKRVASDARLPGDRVLQQAVGDDHVRTDELDRAHDPLLRVLAVVDYELELERLDAAAGLARTEVRAADRGATVGEAKVGGLEGRDERGAVERALGRVREDRVPFDLVEPKMTAQTTRELLDEVGEDVGRVIEFHAREVARVAADIGDQQRSSL